MCVARYIKVFPWLIELAQFQFTWLCKVFVFDFLHDSLTLAVDATLSIYYLCTTMASDCEDIQLVKSTPVSKIRRSWFFLSLGIHLLIDQEESFL